MVTPPGRLAQPFFKLFTKTLAESINQLVEYGLVQQLQHSSDETLICFLGA
jgi:hypothetical protein